MLRIAEIFYSVQGEIDIGKPSIFVRLSGCNLITSGNGCEWCDSKYAQEGKDMMTIEIVDQISSYNCNHVVITGGEPLVQRDGLFNLVDELIQGRQYKISIETNGTLFDSRMGMLNHINCSPKKQSINFDILRRINWLPQSRFKFVFEKEKEKWWETVIDAVGIKKDRVWIMPEGTHSSLQIEDSIKVVEYCKEKGFNFTPRLHILLWGPKRGV